MNAYLFSTDHAGPHEPYLVVKDQNAPRPGHPDGKSWVPWKPVNLEEAPLDIEPGKIVTSIERDGYYVSK